ncbi:hypothetical protein COCON_G00041580 [Conger conger]|uniref:protein-tyrosine-phosphatase n=1 Tax=Conger conger TaxID=82655 RepID=A0A9Q1I3X3_CONCO|nr:hypothetical protein COCON_G00041580 [Conger conger]
MTTRRKAAEPQMPPLPLDERIVVIQRPKSLPLRARSRPHPGCPSSSSSERRRKSSRLRRAKGERGTVVNGDGDAPAHSRHSDGTVTLGSSGHRHTHTIDIKLSLGANGGGPGGTLPGKSPGSSLSHSGSVKGNKEKKVSLHLGLGQGGRKPGGTLGKEGGAVQQLQNHPQNKNKTQASSHHPQSQLSVSPGGVLGLVPAQGQHPKLGKERDQDPPPPFPQQPSQTRPSRSRERPPRHGPPASRSSSRGGGGFPSPDHACTLNLAHPCGCWRLVRCGGGGRSAGCRGGGGIGGIGGGGGGRGSNSRVTGLKNLAGCLSASSTTNTSSSNSTMSDCQAGLLRPLGCGPCSRGGADFQSPAALRKKLVGGCLPCAPLSSSAPLRALQSCVAGCNPKASHTGSSTCSYCSSDPIVIAYNPRGGGKGSGAGRGGAGPADRGAHSAGGLSAADDDDYSVRTIWPEELARKMTRSTPAQGREGGGPNGTGAVVLDCRNLREFTQAQLTDRAGRRRLQQGKTAVLDFIRSGADRDAGRESLKRLLTEPRARVRESGPWPPLHPLPSAQSLHLVLDSLNREQNGESGKAYPCDPPSSLPRPPSPSDEGAMTPDVENAALSPILPFLFLGNERDARDLELLLRLNVGFVVNVTTHLPLYHLTTGLVRYKRLPATDSSKQNLRQYFEEVFEFIEEAHQGGRGVLVHCQAGVSRSATIVIAYLMKHTLMTMTDAYKYVKSRRPVVSPNLNFMGQLLEFERDLNSGVTPRILTPKLSGLETQV